MQHHMGRLLAALDIVILSKTGPAEFESLVPVPHWFQKVFALPDGEQRFTISDELSFLGVFLPDADEQWRRGGDHMVWSGPWTEEVGESRLMLEAGATTVDGDSVLVVKLLGEASSELQETLQVAREQSLRFEDLFRGEEEREKYRRYLESEVQKRTHELGQTVVRLRQTVDELNAAKDEIARQREYFSSLFNGTPLAVALVDKDGLVVDFNPAFTQLFGWTLAASRGRHIDELVVPESKKAEAQSVSRRPGGGLVTLTDTVRSKENGTLVPVSMVGAPVVIDGTGVGTLITYRDITEEKVAQQRLEDAFIDVVETVSRAMESMDPYTAGHQKRVARMAQRVGEVLGYDDGWLEGVYIGGLLHDIGKIAVPPSILVKPGALRDEEWKVLKSHAVIGYEILNGASLPWRVDLMARHHHERLDGSGYPDGLKGDELTSEVRVLGVCDVVEAMSSHRPYRPRRSIAEVQTELSTGRGVRYDAAVVDVVLNLIAAGEFPLVDTA